MVALSLAKLAGATVTVTLTTADDAIWLVPYTAPYLPLSTRITHGLLFILTLEVLACGCVAISSLFQWVVASKKTSSEVKWPDEEIILGSIGAGLCWVIAIALFVRKYLKKRRRAAEQGLHLSDRELHRAVTQKVSNQYGSIPSEDDNDENLVSSRPSPWAVISFTTLGALDEVSYFPSLLLGGIFTPYDLCLGTFFAACIVLAVVTLFLAQCKPLLDFLDRIPLYGIVATFATALTLGVIFDVMMNDG
ncbi:hypothetical protein HJC23_011591 [Cyclotella cryptica]|uniref:GDT1 family protein n=1 Tax=Cyclotella cryptica TaxID=29204 RepID=A0ABD3QRB6_9STRA|eukprot:CCRYP_002721-RA/>CCRYP_002721-RA protein AED:0.28 eAED:0.27 QI:0/-1/0/1/-1/1/1/0/248